MCLVVEAFELPHREYKVTVGRSVSEYLACLTQLFWGNTVLDCGSLSLSADDHQLPGPKCWS